MFWGVRFSYTPSSVPYFSSSSVAVLGPTPATPGMLSELSPMRAFRSMMRMGSKPYSARKTSGV